VQLRAVAQQRQAQRLAQLLRKLRRTFAFEDEQYGLITQANVHSPCASNSSSPFLLH